MEQCNFKIFISFLDNPSVIVLISALHIIINAMEIEKGSYIYGVEENTNTHVNEHFSLPKF